jgi:hypothetical protein
MKTIAFLIILSVLQSYCLPLNSQDLQFYREDITFKLNENYMATDACYYFCNTGNKDVKTQLFYPFPENTLEQIDTLMILDLDTHEVISYRKGKTGVFFGISVKAYGQSAYRIYFQQWLTGNNFKYILTSTKNWGRALEFANFELLAPVSLSIDSISYPADTSYIKDNLQFYFWKKKDFMPARDFEVAFH